MHTREPQIIICHLHIISLAEHRYLCVGTLNKKKKRSKIIIQQEIIHFFRQNVEYYVIK